MPADATARPAPDGPTLDRPVGSRGRSAIPFRGGGFAPGTNLLLSIAGLAAFLALWQLAFAMRWVNPVLLPGPIEVARAFAKLAMSGEARRSSCRLALPHRDRLGARRRRR